MAESVATGIPTFLVSLIVAGALFPAAPSLLEAVRTLFQRILPARGQELLKLAGATIRNLSQGVIGIALLQAILAGSGFPSLAFREAACLPSPCLFREFCRSRGWWSFRSYLGLDLHADDNSFGIDGLPRASRPDQQCSWPYCHGSWIENANSCHFRRSDGRRVAHGIIGLFIGPIVLAVTWELIVAWFKHEEAPPSPE